MIPHADIADGIAYHQAGRLAEAEAVYRQILARDENHADARHLLGVIAHQLGKQDLALELITKAIALAPGNAMYHCNLGEVCRAMGRLDRATKSLGRALMLAPGFAMAHNNLGRVLHLQGKLAKSIGSFRQAVRFEPDYAEAHFNLGNVLMERGLLGEAIVSYRRAAAIKPGYADAYNNLGNALKASGLVEEAIEAYQQALAIKPEFAEVYNNLGAALLEQGHGEEALASHRKAVALNPGLAEAQHSLGFALQSQGLLGEGIASYRRALAIAPDYAECHLNLALALLLQGNFREGPLEFEWRWKCPTHAAFARRFAQPQWQGEELSGRTLLLHTEQGFGDTIHFIRYAAMIARSAGRVVVECPRELRRLLAGMRGIAGCVARGDELPAFDVHCPVLSLPLACGTTLGNVPEEVPYLFGDSEAAAEWSRRLTAAGGGLRVGLVWAGNPAFRQEKSRSPGQLLRLAALSQVRGARFYSLQKGEAARQAREPPAGMELTDWTGELRDFADTAALIAALDLVISSDTAVAHLAGAMGKRVWVMLPYVPDWRWMLGREDSPWYPTMRLFRQSRSGDWEGVVREIAGALRQLA